MTQKTILSILIGAVVVVGGYFLVNSDGGQATPVAEQTGEMGEAVDQGEAMGGKKMAFSEFIKRGGSYKCEINQLVGESQTQGTAYISGGMIRGEYQTQVQGMSISTNMILRDGYTYSWSSMMPTAGYKVKAVATGGAGDASTGTSGTYSFNAEQIGDYNCEPWAADAATFALPAGITFTEMGV